MVKYFNSGWDVCLLVTISIIVIINIVLACSIGLVLPKHMLERGWIYIGGIPRTDSPEVLKKLCKCKMDGKRSSRLSVKSLNVTDVVDDTTSTSNDIIDVEQ
ncbi:uncharacterized protein LOC123308665 [Coccinella septempunctata]|uniref:uncharacterized protein LOC123308665 n=1 Tax=Coccinella septempunctata TaxID=41139 RepID=UPI001D095C75|nr:uncharacterized protein LOC123308665 [Coccinella septempunctata]